jgi:hypothetical protein
MKTAWKYGAFEQSWPAVFNDEGGFVLFDERGWIEMPSYEFTYTTHVLSKSEFEARFPNLPPLPE